MQQVEMSFINKVVLITGGSSGIGAATAIKFAKACANVVIVGRNEAKLEKVAGECTNVGKQPLIIKADVTNEEDAKAIITKSIDAYKQLDVLVNNAGIARFVTAVDENLLETYDEIMNTNLRSVVNLTSLSIPHLIKTKGNVVNISSMLSTKFMTHQIAYGTSKAGLDYFTRAAALDLAALGVRVNAVNPGYTRTDLGDNAGIPVDWDEMSAKTPAGRTIEPEEVADMIMYIAGNKAKSITGSTALIDNGFRLLSVH